MSEMFFNSFASLGANREDLSRSQSRGQKSTLVFNHYRWNWSVGFNHYRWNWSVGFDHYRWNWSFGFDHCWWNWSVGSDHCWWNWSVDSDHCWWNWSVDSEHCWLPGLFRMSAFVVSVTLALRLPILER